MLQVEASSLVFVSFGEASMCIAFTGFYPQGGRVTSLIGDFVKRESDT